MTIETEIKVLDCEHIEVTREHDPSDRWSGEDTHTEHHIEGVAIASKKSSWDLIVNFELKFEKDYCLVFAIYNSGDSFSHHSGKIAFVGLYESDEDAEAVKKILEVPCKENDYGREIGLHGKKETFFMPWNDYFSSLTYIEVQGVQRIGHSRFL